MVVSPNYDSELAFHYAGCADGFVCERKYQDYAACMPDHYLLNNLSAFIFSGCNEKTYLPKRNFGHFLNDNSFFFLFFQFEV
ncbi:MAG: hypothetical protein ACI8RD_012206 [Bacillariaceae sp.]|jgi:hypothetical protein